MGCACSQPGAPQVPCCPRGHGRDRVPPPPLQEGGILPLPWVQTASVGAWGAEAVLRVDRTPPAATVPLLH